MSLERKDDDAGQLARLAFLESRSDWPVSGNLRRIALVGLLPPVTWVLAAVVENALY